MTMFPDGFDVQGPVQAEVLVIWLAGDHIELTGPCGAAPWLIELGADDHPVDVVTRIVSDEVGVPLLVHSTSWRRDREAVILSFVAVIDRTVLARGEATAAPQDIATTQVVEHGLRHMAWLAEDDPVVAARLSPDWRTVLSSYVPEPFRNLG